MDEKTILQIVKDIENAPCSLHAYAYARTIRNILVGNPKSPTADFFKNREYYGSHGYLRIDAVERYLKQLVQDGKLDEIYTENGQHNILFRSIL